jgi:hypothetical protein
MSAHSLPTDKHNACKDWLFRPQHLRGGAGQAEPTLIVLRQRRHLDVFGNGQLQSRLSRAGRTCPLVDCDDGLAAFAA